VIALAVSLRRSIIAERVRAGLAQARAEGKRLGGAPSQRGCSASLLKPVADTIERFYHVKLVVLFPELLAQALDVAVDGAVVDVDLIVIGGIH